MVALDVTQTSKALAVVGGYTSFIGLVTYFVKEKLFLSESLLALLTGIIFGPVAANICSPIEWVNKSPSSLRNLTFEFTRIIIAIQVLFTGIALPKAYLWKERLSLFTLLIPIMTAAWFASGLLVWGLIPGLTFLEALVIGSCVTPTDPVLANAICKGRFAEKYVPLHVRNIVVAESGANDGLGYPFLYIGLYLILIKVPDHKYHTIGGAVGEWIYNILLYDILLSCVLGALIGFVARKVLRFAEQKSLIDHESFLAYGVALTFFTLGVVGILGSDDILCCFAVGNSFTWDDWFREETEDHAFQDVIDNLLNSAVFLFIGAILPWDEFNNFWGITPWRLVVLGILIMLFRRLPWVMISYRWIPTLPTWREAMFAGFFGPIGVGAVFYTQVALQVIPDDGSRDRLQAVITPVVYFLVFTSVIVHGITIPIGKGFHNVRTLTLTRSTGTASGANIVARLPPPLPIGAALPVQSQHGSERDRPDTPVSMSTVSPHLGGPSVAFELGDEARLKHGGGRSRFGLNKMTGETRSNSESGTRPSTPLPTTLISGTEEAQRPSSSAQTESNPEEINHTIDASPMAKGTMPALCRPRSSSTRESAEDRRKGSAWIEGDQVVVEKNNGEDRVVMSLDEYKAMKRLEGGGGESSEGMRDYKI